MFHTRCALAAVLGAALLAGSAGAADLLDSLKKGTPDLKAAGPLAFAPEGILLVGDPAGAAVFAIDTGDRPAAPGTGEVKVAGIDAKVGSLLGTDAKGILINDMAVNPLSGTIYLSVSRGRGPQAAGVLVRVDRKGKVEEVSLKDVKFARAALPNPPENARQKAESITKVGYAKGKVIVAGLSNEEWASKVRVIPFPFSDADKGASVGIFHGAHGRFETYAPVRTFAPYDIKGETHILAAYTCTPLVKFPLGELKPGTRVRGVTVAELGNRNKPLDMIVYQKEGKDYILMANSSRGMMKIATDNIDKIEGISKRVADKAGLTYETIPALKGVMQMDRLDKDHAVVLMAGENGSLDLSTIPLP